ncbi:MAG: HD domain-containing protein [bacterium]|nr:HD domain-containing protein [bacterium]
MGEHDIKKEILIVEDDQTTAALIQEYLVEMGYELPVIISTGEEAIKRAEEIRPDMVLMDIVLAGKMDGIETGEYIYKMLYIPVIFLTVSCDDETLERAQKTNPFGYIVKPVNKYDLKAAISMALVRFHMERTLKENELRFSTILNSIGDGVIVINSSNIITYINPTAEYLLGAAKQDVIYKELKNVATIENSVIEKMKVHQSSSALYEKYRNYMVSHNGKRIPVDFNATPQKNNKGDFIGTVIVFRDITDRIKSEDQLQDTLNLLRKAMGGIIHAMAQTVETRDPYTAGHQRKVADIARSIAEFMNLSQDSIEGIRMSGVIHDLGKISIPAEILSKPGRISEIEFNLIKTHPQVGYDILKKIEFPWPVADIIYQHHERINGTGYPQQLKGDEIRIEAKIIAIADVVEAMASHRPYRPALGIEVALAEISKNKGIMYDTEVAEACIKLFTEGGYTMEE